MLFYEFHTHAHVCDIGFVCVLCTLHTKGPLMTYELRKESISNTQHFIIFVSI